MIELVAVEALRAVIDAMEHRRPVCGFHHRLGAVVCNVDELQLTAAIDVARLARRIDELEASRPLVEDRSHARLRIAVGENEEAELIAGIDLQIGRALAGHQRPARTGERCVGEQNLHARDRTVGSNLVDAEYVFVSGALVQERDRADVARFGDNFSGRTFAIISMAIVVVIAVTMATAVELVVVVVRVAVVLIVAHNSRLPLS